MNTVDLIAKKRDGFKLSPEEITYLVDGYTSGNIPDYQMSALLMAIYFNPLSKKEIESFTFAMRDSGDVLDLSAIEGIKVDKHSTGGVGDKTTLIVAPIAAACGVKVAKMSGRGLGFTGGTLDKLESIPGFNTSVSQEQFFQLVNKNGIAVIGQTGVIAPADKKLYALRDVTATVNSEGLIVSSIMSKKLASGSDAILLDVKYGSGAFMDTLEDSEELARLMVDIGKASGKKTVALLTDMDKPLGRAVGNSLEVKEAIDVLKGAGPEDVRQLCIQLGGIMIYLGEKAGSIEEGKKKAQEAIDDGRAMEVFKAFVEGQGGNPEIVNNPELLPQGEHKLEIRAKARGYLIRADALTIGKASNHTGAGREKKEDQVDLSAGIVLNVKPGDFVEEGDLLCTLYGNNIDKLNIAAEEAASAFDLGPEKPEIMRKLVEGIIE